MATSFFGGAFFGGEFFNSGGSVVVDTPRPPRPADKEKRYTIKPTGWISRRRVAQIVAAKIPAVPQHAPLIAKATDIAHAQINALAVEPSRAEIDGIITAIIKQVELREVMIIIASGALDA